MATQKTVSRVDEFTEALDSLSFVELGIVQTKAIEVLHTKRQAAIQLLEGWRTAAAALGTTVEEILQAHPPTVINGKAVALPVSSKMVSLITADTVYDAIFNSKTPVSIRNLCAVLNHDPKKGGGREMIRYYLNQMVVNKEIKRLGTRGKYVWTAVK